MTRGVLGLLICLFLLGATCERGEAAHPGSSSAPSASEGPAEFSFAETARLLAERKLLVHPIPATERQGVLSRGVFRHVLRHWMAHHPYWDVLSLHLGELNAHVDAHLDISNRPSYFVEITGPRTGNCFYFYDATDGEEFLGACFYPSRS
jgi:hypothetical protein